MKLLGQKIGMTEMFTQDGVLLPVTVIKVPPSVVLRQLTVAHDGYQALLLAAGDAKKHHSQPHLGHFKKIKTEPKRWLYESRGTETVTVGSLVHVQDWFAAGSKINVSARSKGKGFTGVIKKNNQSRGPKTHGSHHYRRVGSRGAIVNRIFKNRALPGQHGHRWRTAVGVRLVAIKPELQVVLVHGAVPGPNKSWVYLKSYTGFHKNPLQPVQWMTTN